MAGNIKFGPDVEHIAQMGSSEQDRPGMIETDEEGMTEDEDWWTRHLQPSANNKDKMVAAIHDYVGIVEQRSQTQSSFDSTVHHLISFQLPNVDPEKLQPDYAGIRPNLSPPGSKFTDFHISYDPESRPGLIALCGFNSPGLTSSLAVATDVEAALSQAGR
jgi:L-2-hydroxyglutarate oxidase LhgO